MFTNKILIKIDFCKKFIVKCLDIIGGKDFREYICVFLKFGFNVFAFCFRESCGRRPRASYECDEYDNFSGQGNWREDKWDDYEPRNVRKKNFVCRDQSQNMR